MKHYEYALANGTVVYRFIMSGIGSNMYLILGDGEALLVDPNINEDALELMKQHGIGRVRALLTHEHFDHISGVNWLREHFDVHVICTEKAAENIMNSTENMAKFGAIMMMDKPPEQQAAYEAVCDEEYTCSADETIIEPVTYLWQGQTLRLQPAPGHSKGSVLIYLDDRILFTGDSLVNGTGVILRLPGGSKKAYAEITRPILEGLPDDTMVFPGHGEPDFLGELREYLEPINRAGKRKENAL